MYKLKMSPNEIRKLIQIKPKEWQNITTTNCYVYALGLDIRENDICKHAYQPGSISKILNLAIFSDRYYYSTLVKNIEKDLKKLKILFEEIEPDDTIKEDEWKIALFIKKIGADIEKEDLLLADFHFLRINSNGVWTHKEGYCSLPTETYYSDQIITNPKDCDLSPYEYQKCYALRLKER